MILVEPQVESIRSIDPLTNSKINLITNLIIKKIILEDFGQNTLNFPHYLFESKI